jgi:hypothetical protein
VDRWHTRTLNTESNGENWFWRPWRKGNSRTNKGKQHPALVVKKIHKVTRGRLRREGTTTTAISTATKPGKLVNYFRTCVYTVKGQIIDKTFLTLNFSLCSGCQTSKQTLPIRIEEEAGWGASLILTTTENIKKFCPCRESKEDRYIFQIVTLSLYLHRFLTSVKNFDRFWCLLDYDT